MTTYIPEFESQRDQNAPLPWTNCTLASGAMLVDIWTYGRKETDDIILRRLSGVPIDQGTNFAALRKAILAQYPTLALAYSEKDGTGTANITWAALRDHLARGGGAVVCGNYSSVADHQSLDGKQITRWQPGGTFGHAVFVCDYRPDDAKPSVLWMDPLAKPDGYAGDRIPIAALWDFIWRNGNGPDARVTAAHGFVGARPAPISEKDAAIDRILTIRVPAVRKALSELEASLRWTRNLPD